MLTAAACLLLMMMPVLGACGSDDATRESRPRPAPRTAVPENAPTPPADTPASPAADEPAQAVLKRVEAALLAQPGLGGVSVSWNGAGEVTLYGTVPGQEEKIRAERIAAGVRGVRRVASTITLGH